MCPELDDPEVRREVRATFDRYEAALVANDLATLDELFWDDERVVRFGLADRQHGAAAVAAFRHAQVRQTAPRTLTEVHVVAFGADVAVVNVVFQAEGVAAPGRQSQVWLRRPQGWRVASAHVSWQGSEAS